MTLQTVQASVDFTSAQIKTAKAAELEHLLFALMLRRIDMLEQIMTAKYEGSQTQIATLQSWDTIDQLIEWRSRDEDVYAV